MADELAFQIYLATKKYPKEEIYALTSQLRRAALSIPTNIVEGYSRRSDKELAHFLNISLGSLAETKYLLHFSSKLNYLEDEIHNDHRKTMTSWEPSFGGSTKRLENRRDNCWEAMRLESLDARMLGSYNARTLGCLKTKE